MFLLFVGFVVNINFLRKFEIGSNYDSRIGVLRKIIGKIIVYCILLLIVFLLIVKKGLIVF